MTSVLSLSLDSQIASSAPDVTATRQAGGQKTLGDPVERQRRYAAKLTGLHIVVKTGRNVDSRRIALAPNAWAYPTRSRSRYTFILDAYRISAGLCRREAIDVISSQDPFATGLIAFLLARRFRKPLNVQLHFDVLDNPYWLRERAEHRLLNLLGKWLLHHADTVRVGTTCEQEKLASWPIPRERIFVAPVAVDLDQFASARPDAALLEGDHAHPIVLAACRLVPQKDLPTLLRAAAIVCHEWPNTRFVIVGDGPLLGELTALASRLGVDGKVRFLGRVDHSAMPGLLAAVDVLAVSSVYEGTSLITVQAAAAGKPVVTTNVAGAADTVIDGRTGRVVPLGDAPALARALLDVIAHPARAAQMGLAGQAHVRHHFALEHTVERTLAMWEATAAGTVATWPSRPGRVEEKQDSKAHPFTAGR